MDPRIIQYYKLCAVTNPRVHAVANSELAKSLISAEDTKKYFQLRDHVLVPNETVVGAGEPKMQIRSKIIVV